VVDLPTRPPACATRDREPARHPSPSRSSSRRAARSSRWTGLVTFLVLSGLIIPPAVAPTIRVLQGLGLFQTMPGPILVEMAFGYFRSQYTTQDNLLFMNILLITIPPLVMFLIFTRRIVAGLTAGALKG
jgi:ABC-type glycerol-3-phosphate transport system permease component